MEKIFKKSLALMVSAALCLTAFVGCLTVNAEETATPTYTITAQNGKAGGTVEVKVDGTNLTSVCGQQLFINIPSDLTIASVKDNAGKAYVNAAEVAEGEAYDYNVVTTETTKQVRFVDIINFPAAGELGAIATAEFHVVFGLTIPEGAEAGDTYTIGSDDLTMFANYGEEEIAITVAPATITVQAAQPACDHANATYDYSVVDGNCVTKKVCPDCGKEETIATVANTTTDVKKSPVLAEGLAINFRTVASAVADYSDIYGVFTKDLYTGNDISGTDVVNIVATDETVSKVNYKTCKYTGIASYEMTSNIHVALYGKDSDGNVILIRDLDYKFVDYLNEKYSSFTGNMRALLGRLADYGTYMQILSSYNTAELPSDTMPEDLVAELPTTFENTTVSESGIKIYRAPKVGNAITINYRLLKTDVAAYDDFSLQISYIDAYNNPQVATASLSAGDFTTFTSGGKEYWSYEFKNLVAAKINDILDVKLVSGETEIGTLSFGIESYAKTQYDNYKDSTTPFYYNLAKACQAIVAYGRAMAALYS